MPHDFPAGLAELAGYLDHGLPEDHAFASLQDTLPGGGEGSPDLWLLGSSPDSAHWAAERGLPYCFADFINSDGAGLARAYRSAFRPSARWPEPHVMVATWTIAAPTGAEAERLAAPARMMFAHLVAGNPIAVPGVEEALAWLAANPHASRRNRRTVLGTPPEVRLGLDRVAEDYRADEVMLVNILHDHAARRRSYELVAAEYGLARAVEAA